MNNLSIHSVDFPTSIPGQPAANKPAENGAGFGDVLQDALQQVSDLQAQGALMARSSEKTPGTSGARSS